jgi:HNH endonuclease/AP2 domain
MTKPKNDLTAEAVRRLFIYDPYSGLLQYRERGPRRPRGWFAGAKDPKSGYLRVQVGLRKYLVARLAWLWMTGQWPKDDVDHVDLDRTNNRWGNLRPATRAQNIVNSGLRATNKSGFKGVSFKNGRWRATIRTGGRCLHLGYFPSPEEASRVYEEAASQSFGEFHRRLQ